MINHISRVALLAMGIAWLLPVPASGQDDPLIDTAFESRVLGPDKSPSVVSDSYLHIEEHPLWVRAEYLQGWLGDNSLPALVTTSPNGTLRPQAGVLGEPGTSVLIGGAGDLGMPGFRGYFGVRPGHWCDNLSHVELEADILWLGEETAVSAGPSMGDPILARPFFDTSSGAQSSSLVAYPGVVAGTVATETSNEIQSIGAVVRRNWWRGQHWQIDGVAGYRYFKLRESLALDESLEMPTADPWGRKELVERSDRFGTVNYFHGGEIGLLARAFHCNWELEIRAKLAIGGVRENLAIDGLTTIETPNASGPNDWNVVSQPGGLLAAPQDLGRHGAGSFAVLPHADVALYRWVTPDFVFTVGYTVVMLSDVVRLGDQIELAVNSSNLPDAVPLANDPGSQAAVPSLKSLDETAMFFQAVHVGFEW